ncbi:hypothetical protein IJD15_04520 [bacterium]|nr:hypothetical protein [bacterium]
MKINSINTVSQKNNNQRKNKAVVTAASIAGSALGVAGTVAGLYAIAKKGNPATSLLNLKYAEKDVLLIGAGSIVGGLAGGLIADHNKENINPKLREASQQFVGNTLFPIVTSAFANKALDKSGFKLPQINSTSKIAKIANVALAAAPKVVVTLASLIGGMQVGNKLMNTVNNKIFKEDVKHSIAPEDMLVHSDDICLTANMLLKDTKVISSITSKALPLTMIIPGAKAGMQQKEC